MSILRLCTTLALATATAASLAAGTPGRAIAEDCTAVIDPCCSARPTYVDPNYTFSGAIVVGTRETQPSNAAVVTIFDITQPYPGDGVNYASAQRYHGPADSWNVTNLGTVFGVTVDIYGNILVAATSCYNGDANGPGGSGAVYRIASGTGTIATFATLPNSFGIGLGNITYDCDHDQFFVTNHEDGRIYRIKTPITNGPVATIQESFDPLGADDGSVGFAPLGERLWGVQWHANRVYYSVWSQNCNEVSGPPNSIRSVALDGSGAFIAGSDQLEIVLPPHVNNYSHPVSDISFSPKGTMMLAERSMMSPTVPGAHESRLMEYACGATGLPGWAPSGNSYVLGVSATCCCSGIAGNGTNSGGGVDCDFAPYVAGTPNGRVWGTSDAINGSLTVYGIQGLPPNGGTPAVSAWLDFDGSVSGSEKTNMGDVEVPCPDVATSAELSMFTAIAAGDALELRWRFGDPSGIRTVELERSDRAEGPWEMVSAERHSEGDVMVAIDHGVRTGRDYHYRLQVTTTEDERLSFGPVAATLGEAVARFALSRITPNPAQGPVQLEFSLPREAVVRVVVVDVAGRELSVLAEGSYRAGRHTVTWNHEGAAARGGVYFVRYQTPAGSFTRSVVVTH